MVAVRNHLLLALSLDQQDGAFVVENQVVASLLVR